MRRALLIGAVAGVTALLASGVASFWLTANVVALPDAPRPCSAFSSDRCFGTVAVGDIVRPLRERGFACTEAAAQCDLSVGGGAYRVLLLHQGNAMHGYQVEARFDRALGPGRRALDLLSWFAGLPFGHDPATASAASAWTLQRVRAHIRSAATINGYAYEVKGSGDQAGASLPECPSGTGCTVLFLGYLMLSVQVGSR